MKKKFLTTLLLTSSAIFLTSCNTTNTSTINSTVDEKLEYVFNNTKVLHSRDTVSLQEIQAKMEEAIALGKSTNYENLPLKENSKELLFNNSVTNNPISYVKYNFFNNLTSADKEKVYDLHNTQIFSEKKSVQFADYIKINAEKYSLDKSFLNKNELLAVTHNYQINPRLDIISLKRNFFEDKENIGKYTVIYDLKLSLKNLSYKEIEDIKSVSNSLSEKIGAQVTIENETLNIRCTIYV